MWVILASKSHYANVVLVIEDGKVAFDSDPDGASVFDEKDARRKAQILHGQCYAFGVDNVRVANFDKYREWYDVANASSVKYEGD